MDDFNNDSPSWGEVVAELTYEIEQVEAGGSVAPWLTREEGLADLRRQLASAKAKAGLA